MLKNQPEDIKMTIAYEHHLTKPNQSILELHDLITRSTPLKPTQGQILRGMTDPRPEIRLYWAIREDLNPTKDQLSIGLADPDPSVRSVWTSIALNSNLDLTEAQIQEGLKDDLNQCSFLKHLKRTEPAKMAHYIDPVMLKKGLESNNVFVKEWFEEHKQDLERQHLKIRADLPEKLSPPKNKNTL